MLLLDRNNEPTSTVYYLAAACYGCLLEQVNLDAASLYKQLTERIIKKQINYEFFLMALDFLYLLGKIDINEKGELYVCEVAKIT